MDAQGQPKTGRGEEGSAAVRELRESLLLLGLVVSSMGVPIGLGLAAVRLFATFAGQ